VGHDGTLVVRSTRPDAARWRHPRTLGPVTWSITDSPALTTSAAGEMAVGAVTADARTQWRTATDPAVVGAHRSRGGGFTTSALLALSS
jgi:hypothetical protein